MIASAIHMLFFILFIYLSVNILYLLVMAIAGRLLKAKDYPIDARKKKFAVLITAYQEDDIIVQTIREAADHDYPKDFFDVYLAADQLRDETLKELQTFRAHILPVLFEIGSKARSLNYLLNFAGEKGYEAALILDGDNIMLPGCMEKINAAFQHGCGAVQCHRMAKNTNTSIAILDAISEEINNHLFRKGQRALGFSAATIGSGMAFEFSKLRQVYNKPGILGNPACDREVDFEMMKDHVVVEYLDHAYVLDEKVSRKQVFQRQRTRWMESQIIHLKLFFSKKERTPHKTKDYWNKLFINLAPPRMIFLAALCFLLLLSIFETGIKRSITGISFTAWTSLFIAYLLCLLLSIPSRLLTMSSLRAILYLPVVMFSFLKAAFRIRSGRKEFVHTPKSYTGKAASTKD
ncbi:MAG: glycosyltransferase [Flavitalea sp.]